MTTEVEHPHSRVCVCRRYQLHNYLVGDMPLGMFTFLDFLLVWLALKAALEMAASFEHDTKIAPFFKYLYTLVSYVLERTRS